jgi:N-hydroxyarylamine O-acetyltransferase
MNQSDLDTYLRRIGYNGSRAPTFETLQGIHLAHTHSIAFENLDPFLSRPVKLDLEFLQQKLVRSGRGGWCYEQNTLFRYVLGALGFRVIGLSARVMWNDVGWGMSPRTHMLLLVHTDGVDAINKYVVDVGFGGMTPTTPLQLICGVEQPTTHETFRLVAATTAAASTATDFILQARIKDSWKSLYCFDLQEQLQSDYEMMSWYRSHHPSSQFLNKLIVAKPVPEGRYTLFNTVLTIHSREGHTKRRTLINATELRNVLQDIFKIDINDINIDKVFDRLASYTTSMS